jgi:hypothetical protein
MTTAADAYTCIASMPSMVDSASDNCAVSSTSQSIPSGTSMNIGATVTVVVIVQDASHNSANCTTNFTVVDETSPVIYGCAESITENATAQCLNSVPQFFIAGTDCDPNVIRGQSPDVNTIVGVGSHVITMSMTDHSGKQLYWNLLFTDVVKETLQTARQRLLLWIKVHLRFHAQT